MSILMRREKNRLLSEPDADPFRERRRSKLQERANVLGGQFRFETDSPGLQRIVRHAFGNLPAHRFPGSVPRFLVNLVVIPAADHSAAPGSQTEPPPVRPVAGAAILCGAVETASFVALTVKHREALIVVSEDMLRFPYHLRYELLEFAVYTLAARVQKLVPLHAACVGAGGNGVLVLGPSGAGKSTLALNCLLQGFEFVAEDSVLIRPRGMLATGLANFLHIRSDSQHLLEQAGRGVVAIRKSPTIRRRSGVEKLEVDLRRPTFNLAARPVPIAALVIVSAQSAGKGALLKPLSSAALLGKLAASQRYAANQPGWSEFCSQVRRLPAFELRRGKHPLESVAAVRELLAGARRRSAATRRDSR